MFNNSKSKDFFDPETCAQKEIHILGLGAVGGSLAELFARTGLNKIHIWDMDLVSSHNLANQIYNQEDVDKPKTEALTTILHRINPEMEIITHGEVTVESQLSGYVFLCIDNIDVRRELCQKWTRNPNITFVSDGRMRLTDGNIHSADWNSAKARNDLIASMCYTHTEALKETPVSACGMTLSIVCTPRVLANLMLSNMISFVNTGAYNKFIMVDAYLPFIDAYKA